MKKFKKQGSIPILIFIPLVGILLFIVITASAPFKDRIFSMLYPKPVSQASSSSTHIDYVYKPLGVVVDKNLTVIDVLSGFPASNSGILKGDKIETINVTDLTATSEGRLKLAVDAFVNTQPTGKRDITVKRLGQKITLTVSDIFTPKDMLSNPFPTPLPSGLAWF